MALEHFTVNTSENSKNLTAVLDGKQVTIASVDKTGKFALDMELMNSLDRADRGLALNKYAEAKDVIDNEEKKQAEMLKKGVNAFLTEYTSADLERRSFAEKFTETVRKPFLMLQNGLHEVRDAFADFIKSTKSYEIHFDAYKDVDDVTAKVDYVASAYTNPETKDLIAPLVELPVVEEVCDKILPSLHSIRKTLEPVAEYDHGIKKIFNEGIDHYDMNRGIQTCMDAIRQGIDLENMVELTEDVYEHIGTTKDEALKEYDFNMHLLCRKITEFMGGDTSAFVNVVNLNKDKDMSDVDFVRENYRDAYETICGKIMEGNYLLENHPIHTSIKAVECPTYYGVGNTCFEVEIAQQNGTTFNLLFDPNLEVAQICKKEIDKEQGSCIFNKTNNKHWIDLSVTRNGDTKALIDTMPCVKESLDKYVKENHLGASHEQIINRPQRT